MPGRKKLIRKWRCTERALFFAAALAVTGAGVAAPSADPAAPPAMPGKDAAAKPVSLLEIYRMAEQNDPRFLAAKARYMADREKFPQAFSFALPNISGTAERTRNKDEVITDSGIVSIPPGKAEFNSTTYELSVTQTIFNWAFFSGISQANKEVRRAELDFAAAKQDLMVRAAERYFAVLSAQDNVEVSLGEREANKRQLDLVEARLGVGMSTVTDLNDARARYELAAAQVIQAQNGLSDQHEALRESTGRYVDALYRLGEDVPIITPDPPQVEKWLETARTQNFALQARQAQTEIARDQIGIERAGHYPSIDLVGSHTRTDRDGSISGPGVRTDNTDVGLKMTVPIFQGGLVASKTAEAGHRFTAAQQDAEQQQRATERATRSAYLGVTTAGARIGALKQAVIASESALRAKQEGYEAGINTNIDVLDAQRDLYRAQRDYLAARYGYVLDLLRLKFSAGTLAEEDLTRASMWLVEHKVPAAGTTP